MRARLRTSACLILVTVAVTGAACAGPASTPDVALATTTDGQVRGTRDGDLTRYRAIPYAAPPVGPLRWSPPAPVTPWDGTRDATTPPPACPQPRDGLAPGTRTSEDCLYANVTVPDSGTTGDKPVLVTTHGGGFQTGSGDDYFPDTLARRGDVVVVSFNYRLGTLGGFAHPALGRTGAFGLQDQQAVLRWVRANIAAFGGDPGDVTLSGESSGAMMTCSQLAAPGARGLFHRAIVMSGSCLMDHPRGALAPGAPAADTWQPRSAVAALGARTARDLGCPDPATALACLRAVPADIVVERNIGFTSIPYDTDVLPERPADVIGSGRADPVPVLQGNTSDEHLLITATAHAGLAGDAAGYRRLLAGSFGPAAAPVIAAYPPSGPGGEVKALGRVFTDRDWICPSLRTNQALAPRSRAYGYVFADPDAATLEGIPLPAELRPAATHGSDVVGLWGHDQPEAPLTPPQRVLGRTMADYWINFLHTGDPNGPGLPHWPPTPPTGGTGIELAPGPGGVRAVDLARVHHCDLFTTNEPSP